MSDTQLIFLATHLPQPHCQTGRPAYPNDVLLPGILLVLRSGCRWRDVESKGSGSGVTHWRRLRFWQTQQGFSPLWHLLVQVLHTGALLGIGLLSLDGTLIPSFSFREMTGYSGKYHRVGVKLSWIVDSTGLPLSVVTAPGNVHDLTVARETCSSLHLSYQYLFTSTLLADKGYDSQYFRVFLRQRDLKDNIVPRHHAGPGPPFDPLLAKHRFVVERSNAWLKSFRRLKFRFDRTKLMFEAFVALAVLVMLVRRALH